MLVLSRKIHESVVINDDIIVYLVEIRGDKVRLGVEAPKDVTVHRNEVYEAIKRNGESAFQKTKRRLTPEQLAKLLLQSAGDGQAVLIVTGGVDFVRLCKQTIEPLEREAGANILAIGRVIKPNSEGTTNDERVA